MVTNVLKVISYTERHNVAYLRCSSSRRCDVLHNYASLLGLLCSDALYAQLFMSFCIVSKRS